MKRRQNPDLLSMVGLGTTGGQLRADGSAIEQGIHLRWQIGEGMGFPPGGFDLYRREQNLAPYIKCGQFLKKDDGGVIWRPPSDNTPVLVALAPSGEAQIVKGCGNKLAVALLLPGAQALKIALKQPARYIRITFDERTIVPPVATVFWMSSSGTVPVARVEAQRRTNSPFEMHLFADHIDSVTLRGEDMIICEICVVLVEDGFALGWSQVPLNAPDRIYLPITHPDWGSPHPHAPDDQAEAEDRLPAGLSADRQAQYAAGFETELHDILYDLVGTYPQRFYQITEQDAGSGAAMQWPGLQLLHLIALDPNLSRILGLYWHDAPPDPQQYYDYRLVAHYNDVPFPGRRYHYARLVVGTRYGTILQHEDLIYVSPNPIDVIQARWDGSRVHALFVGSAIANAPLSIRLPDRVPSVALAVDAQMEVTAYGFLGNRRVATQVVASGRKTIVLQDTGGIDTVILGTDGDLALFEVELRATIETMNLLEYVSFHHRVDAPAPLVAPILDPPRLAATRTGLREDGTLGENQSSVGLHWKLPEAGATYLSARASVLYHVRRADRGAGEAPDPSTTFTLLNANAPVLATHPRTAQQPVGDAPQDSYIDRNMPDGWYTYQVRGCDLFGRLSGWSAAQTIRVLDHLPPPPPQAVAAQYLDPADPWLSHADREWAESNGSGLSVSWEWPGMLRLQAPDVTPTAAEFRVYVRTGERNALSGNVTDVTIGTSSSTLITDMTWTGAQDELVGESIRVGNTFFAVVGNSSGSNCTIQVQNLTAPALTPTPGPGHIVFSPDRSYWTDYATCTSWERRLHIEPTVEIPVVSGLVRSVRRYIGGSVGQVAQPETTRTVVTDQPLTDAAHVLRPGALLCEGVVYQACGHTLGQTLKIHIVPQPSATDASVLVEPPANAAFVYYPGRRYQALIADFTLTTANGSATAHVAVSCSDGQAHVADDPIWAQPGRGGLGGRPGNEGPLSTLCTVIAVQRTLPPAPGNVPAAGDPIFAKPANYYGQATYTLTWAPVADAVGYAIYRCSAAALFDYDRTQRQRQQAYYDDHAVFADDPGFADWLNQYDPSLTADDLLTDADAHLDAWRAWAARFYPQLTDADVQALANRQGCEQALSRVNKDSAQGTSYTDTFDGRGQGMYLYRVRAIDAADNVGAWSETYPPVHIYDVTAPATPVVTAVRSGDRYVVLTWRANREPDLKEYWIWREREAALLQDVRRTAATAIVVPDGASTMTYVDEGLDGLETYYYRIAAIDANGNVSVPTPLFSARVADSQPPSPPIWERAEWAMLDSSDAEVADEQDAQGFVAAIALRWLADDIVAESIVERRSQYERLWVAIGTVREPVDAADPTAENARRFTYYDRTASRARSHSYRIRLKDRSGKINTHAFNEVTVSAVQAL